MLERRATDALWRELRDAVVAAVNDHNAAAHAPIHIDDGSALVLSLERGQRHLELQGSREAVICLMWSGADPGTRMKMFIGLRPGAVPPFRLDGHAKSAAAVAAQLLTMFLVEDDR